MGEETFARLVARSTPQEAAADNPATDAGSNGPQRMTQAQRDSLRQRFQSGDLSPEETRRMRERFQRLREAREERQGTGPREGVVFALRSGELVPVPVRTGVTDWEAMEVISGLQEGDSVALLPTAALLRDQAQLLERFRRFRGGGVPGMRRQD